MPRHVVLAYSGGLDTSWCIPHLINEGYDVTTATVDVGGLDEAARYDLESRALILGAKAHHIVDARQLFYDKTVRFLIAGNVRRGGVYPLCVGAERTVQAMESARISVELGADAVAHGCTAAGNDQVRFDTALRAINPDLTVIAPIRDLMPTRTQQVADLEALGLPVPSHGAAYSVNSGLWGVTIGGSETKSSDGHLPESAWQRTKGALQAAKPDRTLVIGFEKGHPVSMDGKNMEPVDLIEALDVIAASYGIGRGIHLGDTVLGLKGRVAFEAPAATVLIDAHRELEKLVLTGRQQQAKDSVARQYGDWLHEGHALDPAVRDLEALLHSSQARVTGEVELTLRTGGFFVEGVRSPYSLLAASGSVYGEEAKDYSARDAAGFARIVGMPSVLAARAGKHGDA
ncbi:MAG: argininosuccinate synthase [Fimbriimonadaceae bacterium]|nr:argininosuccinate synthase [Fimbriimonadaceae bacterium]